MVFGQIGVTHSKADMVPALWFTVWKQNSEVSRRNWDGELAKCRFWPSDFQEPSKLKGDKKEGEKKRSQRNKQERDEEGTDVSFTSWSGKKRNQEVAGEGTLGKAAEPV